MRGLKRLARVLALAVAMMVAFAPYTAEAKPNSRPATISKTSLVYSGTATAVKNPTLVVSTDQAEADITASAKLSNSISTDYAAVSANVTKGEGFLKVTPAGSGEYHLQAIGTDKDNKGNAKTATAQVTFTFTVSNNNTAWQNKVNLKKGKPNTKTVKLTVKIAPRTITGVSATAPSGSVTAAKTADDIEVAGNKISAVPVYTIKGSDITAKNGRTTYSMIISANGLSDQSKARFAYVTTNSSVAKLSARYDKADKQWKGTLTVSNKAYTNNNNGYAEALVTVGTKESTAKYGKQTTYATADYFIVRVIPNGTKIQSAYATVNGKKASSAALVIPAGAKTVSADLGTVVNSNCAGTTVTWKSSDEDRVKVNNGVIYASQTFNSAVTLTGTVKASGVESNTKTVKVKITKVTKKADTVGYIKTVSASYYGSEVSSNAVNGEKKLIQTYFFTAPETGSYTNTFTVEPDQTTGIAATNCQIKAVKDADSTPGAKISLSAKLNKDRKTTTVTVGISKYSGKMSGTYKVLYDLGTADSYDSISKSYAADRYIAIVVTQLDAEKAKTQNVTLAAANGDNLIAVGEETKFTATASINEVPWSIFSNNEDVLVVKNADGTYSVRGEGYGTADIKAKWTTGFEKDGKKLIQDYAYSNPLTYSVVDMTLDKTDIALKTGESANVIATPYYPASVSSDVAVTYTSSNTNVATVTNKGVINAVSSGNAVVTVKAEFKAVSGNAAATVTKTMNVNVSKHTVAFEKSAYAYDVADGSFVPNVLVDGKSAVPDGKSLKLSVYNTEVAAVSGNNTVSFNKAGTSSITAEYKVNDETVKASAQLTLTDDKNKNTYKNVTVVSFNAVKTVKVAMNDMSLSVNGTSNNLQDEYNTVNDLMKDYAKDLPDNSISVTVSLNGTVSKNEAEGSTSAEAVSEAAAAAVTEEAAPVSDNEAAAVSEVSADELLSENAVLSENAAVSEDAAAAAEETAAVTEEATEEQAAEAAAAEAVQEPEVQETVPAEETAAGETTLSSYWTFTYSKDKATDTVKVTVVSQNGVTLTDEQQTTFITDTFGNDVTLSMNVQVQSNESFPEALSLMNDVLNESKLGDKETGKTINIRFKSGEVLTMSNMKYKSGKMSFVSQKSVGNHENVTLTARTVGSGDTTQLVFDGDVRDTEFINDIGKIGSGDSKLVNSVTYYDLTGKIEDYD